MMIVETINIIILTIRNISYINPHLKKIEPNFSSSGRLICINFSVSPEVLNILPGFGKIEWRRKIEYDHFFFSSPYSSGLNNTSYPENSDLQVVLQGFLGGHRVPKPSLYLWPVGHDEGGDAGII